MEDFRVKWCKVKGMKIKRILGSLEDRKTRFDHSSMFGE
jgi:hypothetical protein